MFLLIQCPSIYYHNQIIDISKTVCFSMLISITEELQVSYLTNETEFDMILHKLLMVFVDF